MEQVPKMTKKQITTMKEERERNVKESIKLLQRIVRQYPLNEFLMLISALTWPGNNASSYLDSKIGENKSTGLAFQIYIPSLAKFAILNSNDFVGSSDLPFEKAFDDVSKCIDIINDIKDFIPFEFSDNFEFALSSFLFSLSNQHYRFQGNVQTLTNTVARSLILFRDLPLNNYSSLNLNSIFEEIYGINQSKFFIISAKLLGFKQSEWFDFNNFIGLDRMPFDLTEDDLHIYFNKISINYTCFRIESKDQNKSFIGDSSQFYGYSPFDSFPIIKNKEKFLIVSQHYLIWRTYLPIYFDLLKYFTEKEGSENNSFSTKFGLIFQDYVGIQLEQLDDGREILDEIKFGKSKKDFTDWSLLYAKNKSAILIEVKKHLIPLKAKFLIDKEILEETLINTIIKGLKQIHTKIEAISKKEKGLEVFEPYSSFYPIIVTFDDSYLLNSFYIRSIIDEQSKKANILFQNNWQIITIRELEQIVFSCNKERSFFNLLEMKTNDKKFIYSEWDEFLNKLGIKIMPNNFLQNILKKELSH